MIVVNVGVILLVSVLSAGTAGQLAAIKLRDPSTFGLAGLIFGPLAVLVALLARRGDDPSWVAKQRAASQARHPAGKEEPPS